MKTKHAIGDIVRYDPVGSCGDPGFEWRVRIKRNGWLFVKVQDVMTGHEFDALRWELKPL